MRRGDPAQRNEIATPEAGQRPAFRLSGPSGDWTATGFRHFLPSGPLATLGQRVAEHFERRGRDTACNPLVGALPFDPLADDHLFEPEHIGRSPSALSPRAWPSTDRWSLRAAPSKADYIAAVERALAEIAGSPDKEPLEKLVLARSLLLEAPGPIDALALFDRLGGDPNVTRFLTPLPPDEAGVPRVLVGATPEPLVSKRGDAVGSLPLAGSLPRTVEDAERKLMASAKERREHALVVEAIADALSPYCAELTVPGKPELRVTRTMYHLGTKISGKLARPDETSSAALAAVLHPTPAVGGTPRDRALDLIRELEPVRRGFYAGAVGWSDAKGDGDWYVSLRCAKIAGRHARIYAGAGIVAGSDSRAEADETSAKFRAMLDAFGLDEQGAPVDRRAA